MQMLASPHRYDTNWMEATVTNVDPIRFVCAVKTVRGQYLAEVPWLLPFGGSGKVGMHFSPGIGDQVIVSTSLTYPIIVGCLPKMGVAQTQSTSLSGEPVAFDAGNGTVMKNGQTGNPDKPEDFTPGDWIITGEGGGILGLLSGGTVLAKASALAQILLSKYDDLVRVVARNWERVSDVGQQSAINVKGRLYEFMGWDRSMARSRNGSYELKDVIGDVAAGEVMLGEPDPNATLPVADTRVRKYTLEDSVGHVLMREVLTADGKIVLTIQNAPSGDTSSVTQNSNGQWDLKVNSASGYSEITVVPGSITLTQNGGATVTLTPSGVNADFSGHYVHINSSGVHLG